MIWWITYIVGVIVAFTWMVLYTRRTQNINLSDVYLMAINSLLSWVFVIIWAFMFLREACYDHDFVVLSPTQIKAKRIG